jgi:hypothetical protein
MIEIHVTMSEIVHYKFGGVTKQLTGKQFIGALFIHSPFCGTVCVGWGLYVVIMRA